MGDSDTQTNISRGPGTDDSTLMKLYAEGSVQAFEILYERHAPKLLGYLKTRTRSLTEAEDALQQTFLKVHQYRHQFKADHAFLPWLFSIARNLCTDSSRKKCAVPVEEPKLIALAERARTEPHEEPSHATLETLLAVVPPAQRLLLEQRYSSGMSFDDMARVHGVSAVNLRKRVSRTVKTLKQYLGVEGKHDE